MTRAHFVPRSKALHTSSISFLDRTKPSLSKILSAMLFQWRCLTKSANSSSNLYSTVIPYVCHIQDRFPPLQTPCSQGIQNQLYVVGFSFLCLNYLTCYDMTYVVNWHYINKIQFNLDIINTYTYVFLSENPYIQYLYTA